MIVKDTPRNLEFLNGNPRDLAPMTHEEAVLAGEAEPSNVNEVNMKNASGRSSLKFIKPTISVASTSAVGAYFTFPVCEVSSLDDPYIMMMSTSVNEYNQHLDILSGFPCIGKSGCLVQFNIGDGFAYESVSGSGYSIIQSSKSQVTINIKSSDSVIRIKCTDK